VLSASFAGARKKATADHLKGQGEMIGGGQYWSSGISLQTTRQFGFKK
jgi:hypothetical protein